MPMLVQLTHPFLWRCPDPAFLFQKCNKLNTFLKKVEQQLEQVYPDIEYQTGQAKQAVEDDKNLYKGNAFELLVEALIRLFPCDKRVGPIKDYKVVTRGDIGVDGHGIFGNGKPGTVQCKYRQNDHVLTGNPDHLFSFTNASYMSTKAGGFGVDPEPDGNGKCNMIIFTSADSLNFYTDATMFGGVVHARCRDDLRKLLDGNDLFWEYFQASWLQSLEEVKNG
jgi:hypothetical protein